MKKNGLIIYGGQEIADLDDSIPDPILEGEQNEYTRLIAKLNQHFLPKKNKDYARFKLGNLVQEDDEPMATYYARIRAIAQRCSYTDENDAIRDHLVKTMRNNVFVLKLFVTTGPCKKFSMNQQFTSNLNSRPEKSNKNSKQQNQVKE